MKQIALALGVIISFSFSTAHADVVSYAKNKCESCHDNGRTEAPTFPIISGQREGYIFQSLKAYQASDRQYVDATYLMTPRVKDLTDNQLHQLAAYFSQQAPPAPVAGDSAVIAAGKAIYMNGNKATGVTSCKKCHGLDAEGDDEATARLAGQQAYFIENQLLAYNGYIRKQPVMTKIAKAMSKEEIKAVSVYLQSLK